MQKQLRYISHIFNLIAKLYIFRQDISTFKEDYKKVLLKEQQELWKQRKELGKLYNLVAHVIASSKRTDLFLALQVNINTSCVKRKR